MYSVTWYLHPCAPALASDAQKSTSGVGFDRMYISGHFFANNSLMQVVRILLERCQTEGVAWEDPSRYGDSWTPLMCCVVGNRVALAETLLGAAGPRMPALLRARNRHGSTALHLAAYRGASDMIKLFMRVGEGDGGKGGVFRARDANGLTPAQVARKHSQNAAEELLLHRIGAEV